MNFKIRAATKEDCKDVSRMIMELAGLLNETDLVKTSHKDLERDGFCQNPFFQCLVAEVPEEHKSKDGFTVVGYALYYYSYSTWNGRSLYLEDLYVMQEFRGKGIGKSFLGRLVEVATDNKCMALDLTVWKGNTRAVEFYTARGVVDLTERHGQHLLRFLKPNMDKLAEEAPKAEPFD